MKHSVNAENANPENANAENVFYQVWSARKVIVDLEKPWWKRISWSQWCCFAVC